MEPAAVEPPRSIIHRGPFAYRDFRLLWTGAFLSFIGSWVQSVAQGYFVYDLTGSKFLLSLVGVMGMLPISIFGPFAGSFADMFNRRRVLILMQAIFAASALFLAAAIYFRFIEYWHIIVVALVNGLAAAIEMPTRQSIVGKVVPVEELPRAIPLNAMTFNLARLIGPAIGSILYSLGGPSLCYLINGLSFLALIFAAMAIRADLRAVQREPQPIKDLLFEGMLYTWRDKRLKALFMLETIVSVFGLIYLPMMPAIVRDMLGLDVRGLGWAMTSVAVGGISGLVLLTRLSDRPWRAKAIRMSMTAMGVALILVAFTRSPLFAFPCFAVMGMSAIIQFNTTNTLFQLLSPEHLRGRVLAMHVWALVGAGPFGTLGAGVLAEQTSMPVTLFAGGVCVFLGAIWGWFNRGALEGVE